MRALVAHSAPRFRRRPCLQLRTASRLPCLIMAAMASEPASRARHFRDALYEALSGAPPALQAAGPLSALLTLTGRTLPTATTDEGAAGLLSSLQAVGRANDVEASLAVAELRFGEPEQFREAIYFARSLERDAAGALALLQARRYL